MWGEIAKGAVEGLVRGILSGKGGKSSRQVEAHSFVLRDDQNRGRAVLAMLGDGPGLTLLDSDEQIKAVLALDNQGAHLQFWGEDNTTNVLVRLEGNEPELVFFDANNEPRASLRLYPNGPCFRLWDGKDKCRVMMQVDAEDGPSVAVFDEHEEPVQQLRGQE